MSKSNKELAVEVAIATITANSRSVYGVNNTKILPAVDLESICNIIKSVNRTLEKIDKDNQETK